MKKMELSINDLLTIRFKVDNKIFNRWNIFLVFIGIIVAAIFQIEIWDCLDIYILVSVPFVFFVINFVELNSAINEFNAVNIRMLEVLEATERADIQKEEFDLEMAFLVVPISKRVGFFRFAYMLFAFFVLIGPLLAAFGADDIPCKHLSLIRDEVVLFSS